MWTFEGDVWRVVPLLVSFGMYSHKVQFVFHLSGVVLDIWRASLFGNTGTMILKRVSEYVLPFQRGKREGRGATQRKNIQV